MVRNGNINRNTLAFAPPEAAGSGWYEDATAVVALGGVARATVTRRSYSPAEITIPDESEADLPTRLLAVQNRRGALEDERRETRLNERPALDEQITDLRTLEGKLMIDYLQLAQERNYGYRHGPGA